MGASCHARAAPGPPSLAWHVLCFCLGSVSLAIGAACRPEAGVVRPGGQALTCLFRTLAAQVLE